MTSVKVGVRIRPLFGKEKDKEETITKYTEEAITLKEKHFNFDYVFPATTNQQALYTSTAESMMKSFLEGYNVTIMAYGQTGSGKSYTMGTVDAELDCKDEDQGLIPRFMFDMFESLKDTERGANEDEVRSSKLSVTFVEVYGEDVYDLLGNDGNNSHGHYASQIGGAASRHSLAVQTGESGSVFVAGATEEKVCSAGEALSWLQVGAHNRMTAATGSNATSSRSHAIFTVTLEQTVATQSLCGSSTDSHTTISKLTFVDLAGSERIKKTGAEGQRRKEGIKINEGLLHLGQVINALADEQKAKARRKGAWVNYRNSKLTLLLKEALGGNSKTLFLACVSAAEVNEFETQSTLQYASQARNIQNQPVKNLDERQAELTKLRCARAAWMRTAIVLKFGAVPSPSMPQLQQQEQQDREEEEKCSSNSNSTKSPSRGNDDWATLISRPEVRDFIRQVDATGSELHRGRFAEANSTPVKVATLTVSTE